MPTQTTNGGVGGAAKQVAEHASALARLEMELAQLELKQKAARFGVGVGLLVVAAVFVFYAVGFGFAAIAAAIATSLSVWLSLLIVFGGLFLFAALLALIGVGRIKKATPPVPEQAIEEAKLTQSVLKHEVATEAAPVGETTVIVEERDAG
jgi:protein-S-isoprenylcysteine O-methyltransferase Ste14